MAELKHCPLCGGEARITELTWSANVEKTTIVCTYCGLTLNHERYYRYATQRDPVTGVERIVARVPIDPPAVEVWNRRVGDG